MRLAELIGTLSVATDAGAGMPDGHALRGAIVAVRLAEAARADEKTVREAYYLPLLAMSGCSAESHTAAAALGDEVAIGVETYGLDWGRASEMLPAMLRLARRGRGPIGGIVSMARAMGTPRSAKGDELALGIGIAHVAIDANIGHRLGGVEQAVALTRKHAKRGWIRRWSIDS